MEPRNEPRHCAAEDELGAAVASYAPGSGIQDLPS